MPSFGEILARHGPVLLLDATSARVQAGWLRANAAATWAEVSDEAGVALFKCIEALDVRPSDARALVFCRGPGSVLGVRTSAMAIRAWNALDARPTFSYHGLVLLAHALARPEATLIADARRESWHSYKLGGAVQRVSTSALHGELVMPAGFRTWSAVPSQVASAPYSIAEMLPKVLGVPDLLADDDSPDAFLHEAPSYATWTPRIHRAPDRAPAP